jgi:hypothetical protein
MSEVWPGLSFANATATLSKPFYGIVKLSPGGLKKLYVAPTLTTVNIEIMELDKITKNHIGFVPDYCEVYSDLVKDDQLEKAFINSIKELWQLDIDKFSKLHSKKYAPGKWTVNDILQHLCDTERILSAGALRFARGDKDYIIGFNEDILAANTQADHKPVEQLLTDLITVRKATYSLYASFKGEDFFKTGVSQKCRLTNVAIAFKILGHQVHHINKIKDRYYPLL